jgi:hypothetical protein
MGIRTWAPAGKARMLAEPIDALVVNAAGGTLDPVTAAACAANARLAVVCGSENLAMPDPAAAGVLHGARKLYAPTELGGMMGYLTAVEEYLARAEGVPFDIAALLAAAAKLDTVGFEVARRVRAGDFARTFEQEAVAFAD